MGRIDQAFRSLRLALVDYTRRRIGYTRCTRRTRCGGCRSIYFLTIYGDCNVIDYSATTRYKDYSVTECDDCIVTRVSIERLDRQSTAISKASPYQTTSLSLDQIQINLQESMGRRLRQQWRTRSIDRFDDLDPFLFFNDTSARLTFEIRASYTTDSIPLFSTTCILHCGLSLWRTVCLLALVLIELGKLLRLEGGVGREGLGQPLWQAFRSRAGLFV